MFTTVRRPAQAEFLRFPCRVPPPLQRPRPGERSPARRLRRKPDSPAMPPASPGVGATAAPRRPPRRPPSRSRHSPRIPTWSAAATRCCKCAPEGMALDKVRVSLNGKNVTSQLHARRGRTHAARAGHGPHGRRRLCHRQQQPRGGGQRRRRRAAHRAQAGQLSDRRPDPLGSAYLALRMPYGAERPGRGTGRQLLGNDAGGLVLPHHGQHLLAADRPDGTAPRGSCEHNHQRRHVPCRTSCAWSPEPSTGASTASRCSTTSTKDAPSTWKPGAGWNKKLVAYFDCCGSAQYNQGVHPIGTILGDLGHVSLSRGFAFVNSTELWNNQHANPHLQGETLMMLKEHVIRGVRRRAQVDGRLRRLRAARSSST